MIRFARLVLALTLLAAGSQTQAALVINFSQVGNNVVATATGSLNTTGLQVAITGNFFIGTQPNIGYAIIGQPDGFIDSYNVFFTGPGAFGPGSVSRSTTSGTGPKSGLILSSSSLITPANYASNTALASTSTFANQTISSLGLTPGTYVYSYSASQGGPTLDTITVQVGPAAVPEPASLAMVGLGIAGLGLAARRRKA